MIILFKYSFSYCFTSPFVENSICTGYLDVYIKLKWWEQAYIVGPANLVDVGICLDPTLKVNILSLLDRIGAELEAQPQVDNGSI